MLKPAQTKTFLCCSEDMSAQPVSPAALAFAVASSLHIERSCLKPATRRQGSILIYRSKVNAAVSYQHDLCYLHGASTIIVLPRTCNTTPKFCVDIQEQGAVLLKVIRAANLHALSQLPDAAAPTLPPAQTAANSASTSASASASASASTSTSTPPTASDPPAKAAAPSPTPASPGKQTQPASSATASPPKAPPFEVASESDTPAESASHDQHRFPHVGLIDASPRMVHTLTLQCLLPCLTPDHDFGQKMYAPWMHYLVQSASQLPDKSTAETQQAELMLHMLPCIELAGESSFGESSFILCLAV